jgi:hypothetical protein
MAAFLSGFYHDTYCTKKRRIKTDKISGIELFINQIRLKYDYL